MVTMETSKIHEQKGCNARTHKDQGSLDRLSASIARDGVLEPLLVRAGEDGEASVIAGHRRLPRGLKAISEEFDLTKPQLAEQVDMTVTWVSERLRLLNLPDGAQDLIAAGVVPVEAEPGLRKVAETSPRVAESVCIAAKRHDVTPSDFVRVCDQLLQLTCDGRFTEKPTVIDVRRMMVSNVITDRTERAGLTERINAVDRYLVSEDPQFRLAEEPTLCEPTRSSALVGHGRAWQTSPGRLRRPPPARLAVAMTDQGPSRMRGVRRR